LPQALGKAAAIYLLCPVGFVMPRICAYKSEECTVQQTSKKHIIYNLIYEMNPCLLIFASYHHFHFYRWADHVAHMKETRNALQNGWIVIWYRKLLIII
jgi:hypothetical protein